MSGTKDEVEVSAARGSRRGLVLRRVAITLTAALLMVAASISVQRKAAALDNQVDSTTAFQVRVPIGFTGNTLNQTSFVALPDNMRFVIERVAITGTGVPNGQVWRVQLNTAITLSPGNTFVGNWPLPPTQATLAPAGQTNLWANQEMVGVYTDCSSIAINPGLTVTASRSNFVGGTNLSPMLSISGHLVPN